MFETNRHSRPRTLRRARRGQTLVVALAVMFVLLFIGAVFVAQIGRNLVAAGRSRQTQDAVALAEAGVRYCDEQLTNSEEGADWRPAPTPPLSNTFTDPSGLTDPDYFWLRQGFHRLELKGGRALVRVTYEPRPDDPRSQMLKIESVGRPGELGSGNDPTVNVQAGPAPRLRRELIAYKQIGITDFLRFVTNKDRRANEAFLGTPAIGREVATVYGDPSVMNYPNGINPNGVAPDGSTGAHIVYGGSIRVQSNLRIGGSTYFYASPRGNGSPAMTPGGVQVAGDILLSPTQDVDGSGGIKETDRQVYMNRPMAAGYDPTAANAIRPSADPTFNTVTGLVRDGSRQSDAFGVTRGINHLEPPNIDTYVTGSGVMRYRALTRDSGRWLNPNFNTGQAGYGRGVYINNPEDLQRETSRPGLTSSYSLRADWLNPRSAFSHWDGPFYRPPGVLVELLGDRIRLSRSDNRSFMNPDGTPLTQQGGKVLEIPLSDADRQNYVLPNGTPYPLPPLDHAGDDPGAPNRPYGDAGSYGVNLVIMAEGNVRVKGVYGVMTDASSGGSKLSRVHLTIVSGGTAYIEGNIVKGDGFVNGSTSVRERNSTCAILAKDYTCVNTSMFMSPQNQTDAWSRVSPDLDVFNMPLGLTRQTYDTSASWGVDPSTYTSGGNATPLFLLLRHATIDPGPAYLNMLVNPGLAGNFADALYRFSLTPGDIRTFYPLSLKQPIANGPYVQDKSVGIAPFFEQRGFLLNAPANNPFAVPQFFTPVNSPGLDNLFRLQLDPSVGQQLGFSSSSDYLLGGAMVAPLDIRIEAVLYAQEKSFFVIPGYSINQDPTDTRAAYLARLQDETSKGIGRLSEFSKLRPSYSPYDTPLDRYYKDVFPFYGEPMDIRVTIHGAISENYTASMGDQAEWMRRWGYIPAQFGSSEATTVNGTTLPVVQAPDDHLRVTDPAGYSPGTDRTQDYRAPFESNPGGGQFPITRGLRFTYDPALAMPYHLPTDANLRGDNNNSRITRALRYIDRGTNVTNGPRIIQILPPIPRLPVCPGLLYFGDADRRVGLQ